MTTNLSCSILLSRPVDVNAKPHAEDVDRPETFVDSVDHAIGPEVGRSASFVGGGELAIQPVRVRRQPFGDERVGRPSDSVGKVMLKCPTGWPGEFDRPTFAHARVGRRACIDSRRSSAFTVSPATMSASACRMSATSVGSDKIAMVSRRASSSACETYA